MITVENSHIWKMLAIIQNIIPGKEKIIYFGSTTLVFSRRHTHQTMQ
jgi:hypothetical protein